MTWRKTGGEFDDECAQAGLSDAAYRTHQEAIGFLYKVENMDLTIGKHLLRRFAGSPDYEKAVAELVDLGLWRETAKGYKIVHHGLVIRQSIAAQQKQRTRGKNSQAAWRKRHREEAEADEAERRASEGSGVSGDISGYADRQTDRQLEKNHLEDERFFGEQYRADTDDGYYPPPRRQP